MRVWTWEGGTLDGIRTRRPGYLTRNDPNDNTIGPSYFCLVGSHVERPRGHQPYKYHLLSIGHGSYLSNHDTISYAIEYTGETNRQNITAERIPAKYSSFWRGLTYKQMFQMINEYTFSKIWSDYDSPNQDYRYAGIRFSYDNEDQRNQALHRNEITYHTNIDPYLKTCTYIDAYASNWHIAAGSGDYRAFAEPLPHFQKSLANTTRDRKRLNKPFEYYYALYSGMSANNFRLKWRNHFEYGEMDGLLTWGAGNITNPLRIAGRSIPIEDGTEFTPDGDFDGNGIIRYDSTKTRISGTGQEAWLHYFGNLHVAAEAVEFCRVVNKTYSKPIYSGVGEYSGFDYSFEGVDYHENPFNYGSEYDSLETYPVNL